MHFSALIKRVRNINILSPCLWTFVGDSKWENRISDPLQPDSTEICSLNLNQELSSI